MKKSVLRKGLIVVVIGIFLGTVVGSGTAGSLTGHKKMSNNPTNGPLLLGPSKGVVNENLCYIVVYTHPNNLDIQYAMDWGEGPQLEYSEFVPSGTAKTMCHSWGSPYTYNVKAFARASGEGHSGPSNTIKVTISDEISAPLKPVITGKSNGIPNTPYNYGFTSTDPDGDDISYYIDWGDGKVTSWTTFRKSGIPYSEMHTWDTKDTFTIKAKAKDKDGHESGWGTMRVSTPKNKVVGLNTLLFQQFLELIKENVFCSNPQPPVPERPTCEYEGKKFAWCIYEVTCSIQVDDGPYQVRFDWDDGTYSEWLDPYQKDPLRFRASNFWLNNMPSPNHLLHYYVAAQTKDIITGKTSIWSESMPMSIFPNKPPNIPEKPSGEISGLAGENLTYTTVTTDPDGDNISYLFDWGDGTDSGWRGPYSNEEEGNASHVWRSQGIYTVRVKAREDGKCAVPYETNLSNGLVVHIINQPPTQPNLTGLTRGKTGKSYPYTATSTDPNGDNIIYCFDWGDGTTIDCTDPLPSGQTARVTHTWTSDGTYTITCKASDPSGAESELAILRVTMPKNKDAIMNPLFRHFLELLQDRFSWLTPSLS